MTAKKRKKEAEESPAPDMLAAALAYAKKGWPIFPIKPGEKTPLTQNGVHDATTDATTIEAWWERWPDANIALNCGAAGYMVLDLDPGWTEAEIVASLGEIPATGLVAATPRGGEHRYHLMPQGELTPSTQSRIAPHVDVRSHAGYVLLPPSVTAAGAYTWIVTAPPLYATKAMLRVNRKARDRSADHDTWIIPPDLPENVEKATAWLLKDAKIATEGQGGDGTAYATAAMCKSFGLSKEKAVELMWELWNPRCDPPWSGDEWEHFSAKVRNGYEYNTSPPGNCTEAYHEAKAREQFEKAKTKRRRRTRLAYVDGEPVDYEEWDRDAGAEGEVWRKVTAEVWFERMNALLLFQRMQAALGNDHGELPPIPLYDLDELASLPAPKWDMEGLIGRAKIGMIVGKWGQFKTFIALDMAIALASGSPWPAAADKKCKQHDVPMPLPVLYIAAEGGAEEYNQRLGAALQNRKEIDRKKVKRNFVLATASAPLDTTIGQKAIADMIEHATEKMGRRPKVIICDTLAKSMTGEENSNPDMGKVQRVVAAIQHHLNCSFIFVHHTGKNNDDKSGRGASSMPAGLDFIFHVTGDSENLVATVKVEKQKDAPPGQDIVLQGRPVGKSLAFGGIAKAPDRKTDQNTARLIDSLGAIIEDGDGKKFSTSNLAKLLAEKHTDTFGSLRENEQKREIERIRALIRRNITDAKTPEAKDFRERFRTGIGANTKWVYKDAAKATG